MSEYSCQSADASVKLVQGYAFVGYGVDEEIVVWWEWVVWREAKVVDVKIG